MDKYSKYKKPPRMDLESLYYFVTVANLGSFSMAAEVLHKTISALSYRIKKLEEELGVILMERTTHSIKLTQAGKMLIHKAELIFEWQQTIPMELQQIDSGIEPYFTIVFNNLLYNPVHVANLLTHLYEKFPHTIFNIKRSVYQGVWDALIHDKANFAIGVPSFHTLNEDFKTLPIGCINWRFICSTTHPLANHKGKITKDLIRSYPVINVEDTSKHLQKRDPWRLIGQQQLIVPNMRTKMMCHIKGLGIGFLPSFIADEEIKNGRLVELYDITRSPSPLSIAYPSEEQGKIGEYLLSMIINKSEYIDHFFEIVK